MRGKTNWFAIWTSIIVVAVLLVGGFFVVWLNTQGGKAPDGSGLDPDTGAVVVGDGPVEVEVWADFYCPHCQQFEDIYGEQIEDYVADGEITLNLHVVALDGLNAASGTGFSQRSAGALYCVAESDPAASFTFFQELFAQHPTGPGLSDDELIALAEESGATGAADCITGGEYKRFASDKVADLPRDPETGGAGTPTLVIDGEYVPITGDIEVDLVDRIER